MSANRRISSSDSYLPKSNVDSLAFTIKMSKMCPQFGFIVPTETGLKKSIMDANGMIRYFLEFSGLHNYNNQKQGPENKVTIQTFLIDEDRLIDSSTTLYRPITKKGDPRIWISGLKQYANPTDLIMLYSIKGTIYAVNLSKPNLVKSIDEKGFVYEQIISSKNEESTAKEELLAMIQKLHDRGWIKATTTGPTAVGDTLEHELGIRRNNSTSPDYKGIELKATRITKNGQKKQDSRISLFGKVPDNGLKYRQILEQYGKYQVPKDRNVGRFQIYETLTTTRINGYDLFLKNGADNKSLNIIHSPKRDFGSTDNNYVSSWDYDTLMKTLSKKHKETFFVKAESNMIDGIEYFRYCKIVHTEKPNVSVLFMLINNAIISIDLLAYFDENNKYKDHSMLFKIKPKDLHLLFGEEEVINLDSE